MINPSSPLFVELLLWTVYVLLAVSIALTAWSMVRSMRMRSHELKADNGIAAGPIAWGVALLLVALLALTYALAGTDPLSINGQPFTDPFWLRTSDMLISTSVVLMGLAALGVALGVWGIGRRLK